MKFSWKYSGLAFAAALCMGTAVKAAPLIDISLVAGTTYDSTASSYVSNLAVTSGETVYYAMVGELAPAGTTNNNHPYTVASSELSDDGIGGILGINLTDGATVGQLTSTGTLQNGFGGGAAQSVGTANGSITDIGAILGSGVGYEGGTAPVVMYSGSFTAGTYSSDTISGAETNNFDAKINVVNGDSTIDHNFVNIAQGTDPYIGYSSLTLTEEGAAVPAPGVVPAFGVLAAALGLFGLVRRHRIA